MASTCPSGTLHLNEDLLLVEKEWSDRPRGLLIPIITDLHRRVVPIIRYRLDDDHCAKRCRYRGGSARG